MIFRKFRRRGPGGVHEKDLVLEGKGGVWATTLSVSSEACSEKKLQCQRTIYEKHEAWLSFSLGFLSSLFALSEELQCTGDELKLVILWVSDVIEKTSSFRVHSKRTSFPRWREGVKEKGQAIQSFSLLYERRKVSKGGISSCLEDSINEQSLSF
jgi:hypothetical protein